MRDLRLQQDLRDLITQKQQNGYEIVSRDPIRLRRVGCKTEYVLRNGVLIEQRRNHE